MPSIQVSDLVVAAIRDQLRQDETEDDFLRRTLALPERLNGQRAHAPAPPQHAPVSHQNHAIRRTFATHRMSSYISSGYLAVGFAGAPERRWLLPDKTDKIKLRQV